MNSSATRRGSVLLSALLLGVWGLVVAPPASVSAALVPSGTLTATVTGDGAVTVEWNAPSDNGDGDNYDYTVYYRAGTSGAYTTLSAATTSRIISGLTGGVTYEILVTATPTGGPQSGSEGCSYGALSPTATCNSVAQAPSTTVTAAEKPAAPSISAASTGQANGVATGAVKVEFTAGLTNGATVTDYTATCGGVSASGSGSPITVTGLTNGIGVTCTVTTNASVVGSSAASAASSTATPSTTPDQMAAPTLVAGSGQLTVSWPAVTATSGSGVQEGVVDDGGSAVTGYEVSITNSSDVEIATADADLDATSVTVSSGIVNGTAYRARVRASNANGDAAYSEYSTTETPSGSDVTSPSITIARSGGSGTVLAGGTASLTFELSESASDFASSDVTVSGGSLGSSFAGSGTSYTATFTPTSGASGTATISVAAGAFNDAANNPSLVSNTLSISYDTRRPSVSSFLSSVSSPTSASSVAYTITFSESVTGVAAGDFTNTGTATGCTFAPGADSGSSRTVTVSGCESDGTIILQFASGGATNSAGNTGPSSASTATTTISLDTTAPSVSSFLSSVSSPTSASSVAYTITFSESVTGVAAGDFTNTGTATGCTFAPGADSGSSRTVTVSDCSFGTIVPRFASGGASDLAGNTGPSSASTATTTITREQGDTIQFPGSDFNTVVYRRVYFNSSDTMNLADKSVIVLSVRARNGGVAENDKMVVSIEALGVGGGGMLSHGTGEVTLSGSSYGDYSVTLTPGFAGLNFAAIDSIVVGVFGSNDPVSSSEGNRGPVIESISLKVDGTETITNPEFATGNSGWYSGKVVGGVVTALGWQTCSADSGFKPCTSQGGDVAAPVLSSFASAQLSPTNSSFEYTLLFNEAVIGVDNNDFENLGTAPGCSFVVYGSGTSYTLAVSDCGEGTVVPALTALAVSDLVGNPGPVSVAGRVEAATTVTVDLTRPTVTVGRTGSGTVLFGGTVPITFTLSESSSDFAVDDVSVLGGSLSGFTGSGSSYSATFTPDADSDGTATIVVYEDALSDAAGNPNEDSNMLGIEYETSRPSVASFLSSVSSPTNASSVAYEITFSESVTGVAAGDFTNTGTADECSFEVTGSETTYTLSVSCEVDGTIIPRFAAAGASDLAGNTGPASASTSGSVVTVDTTAPFVATFNTSQSTPTNTASFTYSLTFSENVTGVANDDFSNGGTATGCAFVVSGSGSSYSLAVSSCSEGTVRPAFAIDGATDAAGNDSVAETYASPIVTRDVTAPSVLSFSSAVSSPTTDSSVTYTITFSESVTGVAAGDFTNTGTATGCAFAPGADTGSSRTVTVSSCSVGTIIPRFAMNGAADLAGNTGPGSVSTATSTITREAAPATTAPTATTTTAPTTTTVPPTTTTTLPPTTTTLPRPTTTTAPAVVVAPRFGDVVENVAPPAPAIAEGAAVAVKPGSATVLLDPPDLPRSQSVTQYVVILRPVGGGAPIRRTIIVTDNNTVLKPTIAGLSGEYRVSVAAVDRRGQTVGTWRPGTITVPRRRS